MDRKFYLSVTACGFLLFGCSTYQAYDVCESDQTRYSGQYLPQYQGRVCVVFDEPDLVLTPFHYTGRAWFATDKAILRPKGKAELDGFVLSLQKAVQSGVISPANKIVVIGHTDSRASVAYNQKLSERRAASVADYLQQQGVPAASIVASGKSELQPVATNRTKAGRQENRRVEIHVNGDGIRVVYN